MSKKFNINKMMTQNYSAVTNKIPSLEHPVNCKTECPYGYARAFCYPCMAKIMEEMKEAKKLDTRES